MDLKKGDTIIYSAYGRKYLCPRFPTRQGKVIGDSRSKDCLTVKWRGRKTYESIHKKFIKKTTETVWYLKIGQIIKPSI